MGLRKYLIILAAALLTGLVLMAWFIPLNDDFQSETVSWNGISDIAGAYPVEFPASFSDLPTAPQGTTLVLVPYIEYTTAELNMLDRFISGGGRLIIADDYGCGNQVLEYLGVNARFAGESLLDPIINYKTRLLPSITRLEPNPLTANVSSLTLNHATCLNDVSSGEIIARSSSFSFLDLNDNGKYDAGETNGPLAVVSQQKLGSGELMLIADPSIFINGMQSIGDNANFVQNIFNGAENGVYFDLSHLPASNLSNTKGLLAQAREVIINPAGTTALAVVLLTLVLTPVWQKKKQANFKM
jgi:hypothetical protein